MYATQTMMKITIPTPVSSFICTETIVLINILLIESRKRIVCALSWSILKPPEPKLVNLLRRFWQEDMGCAIIIGRLVTYYKPTYPYYGHVERFERFISLIKSIL